MTVDFVDPMLYVLGLVIAVVGVLAVAFSQWLNQWIKGNTPFGSLVTEELIRVALQQAINYGIGYATQKIKESNAEIKFDNAFIGQVVQYVVERVPDSLEHFGITPTALEAMIKARLGLTDPAVAAIVK